MKPKTMIRLPRLRQKLGGVSDTTVWRRVNDGTIPPPAKIGGLSVWDEAEVDAAIEAALAKRGEAA